MGGYSSGKEDAEVCVEFHEFDVLFTHAVLEHVAFVKDTDLLLDSLVGGGYIEIECLFEEHSIFFCSGSKFICRNNDMKLILPILKTVS